MNIIAADADEAARANRQDLLLYGNKEGALALFGGWTGIDLSMYSDDEEFRLTCLLQSNRLYMAEPAQFPGATTRKGTNPELSSTSSWVV